MPILENTMYNFMGCNQMMFGSKVRYGISYKTGMKSFDVYRRKYMHNLKVQTNKDKFDGSKVLEIASMNVFLVSKIDEVFIFDIDTYQLIGKIPITLLKDQAREPNQVIGMRLSKCENYLAIISGKNLIMDE